MPILGSFGAGGKGGYGRGGKKLYEGDYLVIAGGGAGQQDVYSAGGAGGYRTSYGCGPETCGTSKLKFAAGDTYAITIGGGGAASGTSGAGGQDSSIAYACGTFSASGGGASANAPNFCRPGGQGGSGASSGFGNNAPRCNGNHGGYSPVEGFAGSDGQNTTVAAGGGGGASENGGTDGIHHGGDGLTSGITGSCATRGGGGGGGSGNQGSGPGGSGGGGAGGNPGGGSGQSGSANTGGGGGSGGTNQGPGASGGSGIVVLRFPGCVSVCVTPGTNTVTSCVGPTNDKVATFTVSGCLTVS